MTRENYTDLHLTVSNEHMDFRKSVSEKLWKYQRKPGDKPKRFAAETDRFVYSLANEWLDNALSKKVTATPST